MDTPRQLLVAALALKRGLIDAARFVEAVGAAPGVAVGEVLVHRGWITPAQRIDLECEAEHQAGGKDTTVSPAVDDARKALAFLAAGADDTITDEIATGRYTRTKLHGQGGMGDVWQARDEQVGRLVALKELKAEYAENAMLRGRFLAEARITGQLEHPGIVPVYEVIEQDGEPPFYTMRLVRGRTLTKAVREYHETQAGDELALRDLLQAFVSVCNTLAYAHSRGVVHRDLKGANVVLGPFGEVVVLDWGLAKVLGNGETQEEAVQPLPEGDLEATQEGQLAGTIAYMAPEQALGQVGRIDRRTDVFGLGAILYEILTGRPPYQGDDWAEVLGQAREGTVTPPQQIRYWVPEALGAICTQALMKEPAERYQTVVELADAMKRWLADETVREHRKPVQTHAETVTEILGLIIAEQDPRTHKKEANPLRKLLQANHDRAIEALDGETIGAPLKVADLQNQLGRSYIGLGHPHEAIGLLEKAVGTLKFIQGEDHTDTLTACHDLAVAYRDTDKLELAIPLLERTVKALEAKLGDDHWQTLRSRNSLSVAYHGAGKLDLAIPLLERTLMAEEARQGGDDTSASLYRQNLAAAYGDADEVDLAIPLLERAHEALKLKLGWDHPHALSSHDNLAVAYRNTDRLDEAIAMLERSLQAWATKLGDDNPHTLSCRANLAVTYQRAGRLDEAIRLLEPTLKANEVKLGDDHPQTLDCREHLATAYTEAGRPEEAIPLYEINLAAHEVKLGDDHPDSVSCRRNLTSAYLGADRPDAALPLCERTLTTREAELGADHPDTLIARNDLALAYSNAGRLDEAIPLFEQTLQVDEAKLGNDHPITLTCGGNLASAYYKAGRPDESIPLYLRTLKSQEAGLGEDHPDTLVSRNNLAAAYVAAGNLDAAIPILERTLQADEAKLGDEAPETLTCRRNLALAYHATGRPDAAIPLFERALKARQAKLGDDHPDTRGLRYKLAEAYWQNSQLDLSVPLFEDLHRRQWLISGDDDPETFRVAFVLGANYRDAGMLKEAVAVFDEWLPRAAAILEPGQALLPFGKEAAVETYQLAGQYDKALPLLSEAVAAARQQSKPDDSCLGDALVNLGAALLEAGKPDEAEQVLREAFTLREKYEPDWWRTFNAQSMVGEALASQKKHDAAEPLLLAGYQGLRVRQDQISPECRYQRLEEALNRLVQLYDSLGKPDAVAKWRQEIAELRASDTKAKP